MLGLPPAFNLSHDQTLQFNKVDHLKAEAKDNLNFAQDKTDKLKRNVNIRIEAEASTLTLTELIRVLLAYLDNLVTFPRSSRQAPTRII